MHPGFPPFTLRLVLEHDLGLHHIVPVRKDIRRNGYGLPHYPLDEELPAIQLGLDIVDYYAFLSKHIWSVILYILKLLKDMN